MAEAEGAPAPNELASLTYKQLHERHLALGLDAIALKEKADALKEELARRLASSAAAAFVQADKQHGTVNLPLQDGLKAKVVIDRDIEWDSDKLLEVAQTLPWERVRAIFKIAFSVPEAVYKGIAAVAPELKEKIDAARTTKFKPAKITIEEAR